MHISDVITSWVALVRFFGQIHKHVDQTFCHDFEYISILLWLKNCHPFHNDITWVGISLCHPGHACPSLALLKPVISQNIPKHASLEYSLRSNQLVLLLRYCYKYLNIDSKIDLTQFCKLWETETESQWSLAIISFFTQCIKRNIH